MATLHQFDAKIVASGAVGALAFTQNVRQGSGLVLVSGSFVASEIVDGVTDSLGNTYVQLLDTGPIGEFASYQVWATKNISTSGACSVTATHTATTSSHRVWIYEIGDMGTFALGPYNTLDLDASSTPMTAVALTGITKRGIAMLGIITDTSAALSAITDASSGNTWTLTAGGQFTWGFHRTVGPSTPNLDPVIAWVGSEQGEMLIFALEIGSDAPGSSAGGQVISLRR